MIESHDDAALETLDAAALGIDPGAPWPLVFTPGRDWSPLVISFPHVGLEWPADEPHPRPAIDFARNADLAVHHLYPDAAALGAVRRRALADIVTPCAAALLGRPAPADAGPVPSSAVGGGSTAARATTASNTATAHMPLTPSPRGLHQET